MILRKHLGLENQLWIPVVELLDILVEILTALVMKLSPIILSRREHMLKPIYERGTSP